VAGSASEVSRSRGLDVAGSGGSSSLSRGSRDVLAGALSRGSRVVGRSSGVDGVGRLGWEGDGDDDRLRARAAGDNDNGRSVLGLVLDRLGGLGRRSVDGSVVLGADSGGDGHLAGNNNGALGRAVLDVLSAAGDSHEAGAVDGLGDIGLGAHSRGADSRMGVDRSRLAGSSRAAGARSARAGAIDGSGAGRSTIDGSRAAGGSAVDRGLVNSGGGRRSRGRAAGTVDGRSRCTVLVARSSSDNAGESGNSNSGTHFECSC